MEKSVWSPLFFAITNTAIAFTASENSHFFGRAAISVAVGVIAILAYAAFFTVAQKYIINRATRVDRPIFYLIIIVCPLVIGYYHDTPLIAQIALFNFLVLCIFILVLAWKFILLNRFISDDG